MISAATGTILRRSRLRYLSFAALLAILAIALQLRADEPYAPSRDYNLQHSKIALRFDVEQKKVLGDVTHSLAILRDGTAKIAFDSVGLTIQSVAVNKSPTKFANSSFLFPLQQKPGTNSRSPSATKERPPKASTSFCRTKIIRTAPSKFGRRANPKTRVTIFRHTTIRMTA
jgi:hypothetical protein